MQELLHNQHKYKNFTNQIKTFYSSAFKEWSSYVVIQHIVNRCHHWTALLSCERVSFWFCFLKKQVNLQSMMQDILICLYMIVSPEQKLMLLFTLLFKDMSDTWHVYGFPVFHSFWGTWRWLVTATRPSAPMLMSRVAFNAPRGNHWIRGLKPPPVHKSFCVPESSLWTKRTSNDGSTRWDKNNGITEAVCHTLVMFWNMDGMFNSPKSLPVEVDLTEPEKPWWTVQLNVASFFQWIEGTAKVLLIKRMSDTSEGSTKYFPDMSMLLAWKVMYRSLEEDRVTTHSSTALFPFRKSLRDLLISTFGAAASDSGWERQ